MTSFEHLIKVWGKPRVMQDLELARQVTNLMEGFADVKLDEEHRVINATQNNGLNDSKRKV
jgi:hypothetical protein